MSTALPAQEPRRSQPQRQKWDKPREFLMSCIATSVGLGNVWRFPFAAYQNGGGAFLIPYIVVLLLIGKPMYYLETALGQFSSSNCVRVWALCPAMRGTGYTQALGAGAILSYYVSIIALCLYYLIVSFQNPLPWSVCQKIWPECVPSGEKAEESNTNPKSSAELYFTKVVLRHKDSIHDGIGAPPWDLTFWLFFSWVIIFVIVARGVKSSGKASYFLALFPYFIMFILLIRSVTLPGAANGIMYFITPDWGKILKLKVWYAAVTQVFFSLSVCSGALMMFASYNNFKQNILRDSMIVTTLDTFTSLMAGITIFGILGNLAHQLHVKDVGAVIGAGGTSLAFISYPDAIAQSPIWPQGFAVLFFLMMAVLGVGSGVALVSTINAILMDAFPKVPIIYMSGLCCILGFLVGLLYVTPGGQYILELVDNYGGTFMRLFAAITEAIGVVWIYGLENLCVDIEYMLGFMTHCCWRFCWCIVTPCIMITVFFYRLIATDKPKFGGKYVYPDSAYLVGAGLQYVGILMLPIFMSVAFWKNRGGGFKETIKRSFRPLDKYGPSEPEKFEEWKRFTAEAKQARALKRKNFLNHFMLSLIGGYRKRH